LEIDPAQLRNAFANGIFSAKVETDLTDGVRSGVNGTPCFFISRHRHDGPHDAVSFAATIKAARDNAAHTSRRRVTAVPSDQAGRTGVGLLAQLFDFTPLISQRC
jgi:imidazolonepropionase-like amidohydrolase